MFNSLRGVVTEKRADTICIDVSGVEFEIASPSRSIDSFGRIGDEARAFTWLHHYEDGMRLYGFPSAMERTVFLELIKVEGIGPRQSLRILSGIAPEALDAALAADDLAALQRVPGVGPKLAQKILLALKGKLVMAASPASSKHGETASAWADLIRALVDMGFERKAVEKTVSSIAPSVKGGAEAEREIFRRALIDLSAGS